jgi:uronate dehydrogenase
VTAPDLERQVWALTGAAGAIASSIRPGIAARVSMLRLLDIETVAPSAPNEEYRVADLRDQEAMDAALAGAHGVLHLGGVADEADFHDLSEINIVGSFHVFEAARRCGLKRVVYASSNRLTGFYETATTLTADMPVRPDGLYGVSKVAGEALGRLYADKFGLEVANLRIGSFEPAPQDVRQLSTWLSPADCLRAFLAAMTTPSLAYATFYAVSANAQRWWDIEEGRALGYTPRDDAELYAPAILARQPALGEAAIADYHQGGVYATPEYTLERQRPASSRDPFRRE